MIQVTYENLHLGEDSVIYEFENTPNGLIEATNKYVSICTNSYNLSEQEINEYLSSNVCHKDSGPFIINLIIPEPLTMKNIIAILTREEITHCKVQKDSVTYATKENVKDIPHEILIRILKSYFLIHKHIEIETVLRINHGMASVKSSNITKKYYAGRIAEKSLQIETDLFELNRINRFDQHNEAFAIYELAKDFLK